MATLQPEKDGFDVEHKEAVTPSPPVGTPMEWDHAAEKKLVRKIDGRLLPILGALYSIALIDRVNVSTIIPALERPCQANALQISAARISGMDVDLRLDIGDRYTIALVVFFPPYFLFELPSNIALRKVGSANWLSFIAFCWGTVMLGQVSRNVRLFNGNTSSF